jgi:hypothetical protein
MIKLLFLQLCLHAVVLLHWIVFISMIVILPICSYYLTIDLFHAIIGFTALTTVGRTAVSRSPCPISMLECALQRRLQLTEKPYFIKYHVFPLIAKFKRYTKCLTK